MILKGLTKRLKEAERLSTETKIEVQVKKEEWVMIEASRKKLTSNELYVLGDSHVTVPAIESSSSIKGVKARLVKAKKSKNPIEAGQPDTDVVCEWTFDEDNQIKPVHMSSPVVVDSDLWVEMCNPCDNDAIVSSFVHGMIKSKMHG